MIIDDTRGAVEVDPTADVAATAVLIGPCRIGPGVRIGHYAVIGGDAEHWDNPTDFKQRVDIGAFTTIREHVVVQRGLLAMAPHPKRHFGTSIGVRCYIMHGAHIAHDCVVGDEVGLSPYVVLGGHTVVLDGATMGIGASTHQHTTIGACAMIGMGAVVVHDVPCAAKAAGVPARGIGINYLGVKRASYSDEKHAELARRFTMLSCRPPLKGQN